MSAECDKCGCNLIYGENYPTFECQMCKAEEKIKQLKSHINHVRKVHDYQEQQGNEVTDQLRTAIMNASEFSRRGER